MRKRWLLCAYRFTCMLGLSALAVTGMAQSSIPLPQETMSAVPAPNVLLIVADDLGIGDLRSFYASANTNTPSIDRLAAQGMRFTRFYTESTCSASRAALLTGQYPARLGFHPVAGGISPDVMTMPDWFRQQGYSTHHVGKWHLGEINTLAAPSSQGFDTSLGFLNQWFLQGPDAEGVPVLKAPVYENPWLQDEKGQWKPYAGYLPDILTHDAVSKIESLAAGSAPWFMYYATPLPHAPIHLPPGSSVEGSLTEEKQYQAMLAHLDTNVGQLLAALERSHQRDNTIIVFLSDNGAPEKRKASNAMFGGGKGHYTEGGVRAPLIWIDPGRVVAASVDERVVSVMDIFPTLVARIGKTKIPPVDGLDIASLERVPDFQRRVLYWLSRDGYSMLSADKQWRLTEQWLMQTRTALQLTRIGVDSVADLSLVKWLYFSKIGKARDNFLAWLQDVAATRVYIQREADRPLKVTGNDFLRTPLKDWDFYIAVKPGVQAVGEQVIAEQKGIWSISYNPAAGKLHIVLQGGKWDMPVSFPDQCSLLGLNADIYDRYTNVSDKVNASKLRVSINSVTVSQVEWTINSLRNAAVDQPTWIGASHSGEQVWQGHVSDPAFFHWSSRVGEWPVFIDEKKLRAELCTQLER